jgi:predicted nucleic acid-binding protein
MMRIYLDNCCFNRPFDDQSSLRIRLETEAKLDIQQKIKAGRIALGWSYILDFENSKNPFLERQTEIIKWKNLSDTIIVETPVILLNMHALIADGLKPVDALHIACAIELNCEYFLTVDKEILKKVEYIIKIKIMNPVDFILEWETQL